MNILAVGAHADDIEAKCAGTLLKYKKMGHNIFEVLTTTGNIGSNSVKTRGEIAKIRKKEQIEAAKVIGAETLFLPFDDEILVDTPQTRKAFLDALRWAQPDIIFTHDPSDPSPDHWMSSRILTSVVLCLGSKLIPSERPPVDKSPSIFFWDNGAGVNFVPEVYVDISDFMDMKIDSISKHESQLEWMRNFMKDDLFETFRVISRFRGIQAGCKYAECFRAFRLRGRMPDFKLLP